MDKLWRLDSKLAGILEILPDIKLLSLDIFDTLLLRYCKKPEDVHLHVGKKAKERGLLKNSISAVEYAAIRNYALDVAYRQLDYEPRLEDIFSFISPKVGDLEKLLALEVQAETELSFLNLSMVSLIKECRKRKISVELLSDMYLGRERILSILQTNGFSLAWIDEIRVSVDSGVMKMTGGLYKLLLASNPHLKPDQILHIGDNLQSDIQTARQAGLSVCHYDTVRQETFGAISYEELLHGSLLPEWHALRSLAINLNTDITSEDKFWHQFGAGILGPFLSAFCEHVISIAQNEGISVIAPFMREAHLLAPMLNNIITQRRLPLQVVPLYVSRRSVTLAAVTEFTENLFLTQLMPRPYYQVKDLFGELGFDNVPEAYLPFADVATSEAGRTPYPGYASLSDALAEFFFHSENLTCITRHLAVGRQALLAYLDARISFQDRVITMDIGFFGQIQKSLESILRQEKRPVSLIHAMAFGRENQGELLARGYDFRILPGGSAISPKWVKTIHRSAPVIEQLFMGEEGSTLAYHHLPECGSLPILEDNPIPPEEISRKKIVQKGALRFLNLYLATTVTCRGTPHPFISESSGWTELIHRVIAMPTHEEAFQLGNLHNDYNFGSTLTVRLCPQEDEQHIRTVGPVEYMKSDLFTSKAIWPQGVLTRVAPAVFVTQHLTRENDSYFLKMLNLCSRIHSENISEVYVYGAGSVGLNFIKAARVLGVKVLFAVDKNNTLWGTFIEGIKIIGLEEAVKKAPRCYAITSFAFAEEIRKEIISAHAKQTVKPRIFAPL